MVNSRGVAKPTRFMGAYFTDDLAVGVSDGANAVATAATRARHRKTEREIMVTVLFELLVLWCGRYYCIALWAGKCRGMT